MYPPPHFLHSLPPEGMTVAQQRAADEQLGRTVAAASASWQRAAGRARLVAGLLPLIFRNQRAQPRPGRADALPQCVRSVPETVAKSHLNGHAMR
jgi:hypothetical protein